MLSSIQPYAHGKYISPIGSSNQMKSQSTPMKNDTFTISKKNNGYLSDFSSMINDSTIDKLPDTNKNVIDMEIRKLYNVLDSNDPTKMETLAHKYASILSDDNHDDINTNSQKNVANFVLNSHTNQNHGNMLYMKNLVEDYYLEYTSTQTITSHHLGYLDPHDYTIIYAVLSGLRRKNIGM